MKIKNCLKKTLVIEQLSKKGRPSYKVISEIVGCSKGYVSRIAEWLNMSKKNPILDFRGLLGRSFK